MMYQPKFKLQRHIVFKEHRSGWGYAVSALKPLLSERGVLFDTFIEWNFFFRRLEMERDAVVPYREPWVGILHNPPGIPRWHEYASAPQEIFKLSCWKDSLPQCLGLIVFSQWMADWTRRHLDIPILALKHPTEIPETKFRMEAFLENPRPSAVQVGLWLRRVHSIYELPVRRLGRTILAGMGADRLDRVHEVFGRERDALGFHSLDRSGVEEIPYLSPQVYDRLLSENIVFLHLYDAVVNNALIECIARNTPVLVNPLPSIVEYLGADYPFYFASLEEAARKADDRGCVLAAHEYLKDMPKDWLTGESFLGSLAGSELYQSL